MMHKQLEASCRAEHGCSLEEMAELTAPHTSYMGTSLGCSTALSTLSAAFCASVTPFTPVMFIPSYGPGHVAFADTSQCSGPRTCQHCGHRQTRMPQHHVRGLQSCIYGHLFMTVVLHRINRTLAEGTRRWLFSKGE